MVNLWMNVEKGCHWQLVHLSKLTPQLICFATSQKPLSWKYSSNFQLALQDSLDALSCQQALGRHERCGDYDQSCWHDSEMRFGSTCLQNDPECCYINVCLVASCYGEAEYEWKAAKISICGKHGKEGVRVPTCCTTSRKGVGVQTSSSRLAEKVLKLFMSKMQFIGKK